MRHTDSCTGPQFAHMEVYGRVGTRHPNRRTEAPKLSLRQVVAEAERRPEACPHVASPQPPILRYGCMPSQAADMAEAWADQYRDPRGRRLRSDGSALLAGVVSMPSVRAQDWPEYSEAVIGWLRQEYGDRLRSVIEHTDEAHPHLHWYVVPLPGERMDQVHPGMRAVSLARAEGRPERAGYKAAMRDWQDRLHAATGAAFGLTRHGPRRRRLSRAAWQAEQQQAMQLQQVQEAADALWEREWALAAEARAAERAEARSEAAEIIRAAEAEAARMLDTAMQGIREAADRAIARIEAAAAQGPDAMYRVYHHCHGVAARYIQRRPDAQGWQLRPGVQWDAIPPADQATLRRFLDADQQIAAERADLRQIREASRPRGSGPSMG